MFINWTTFCFSGFWGMKSFLGWLTMNILRHWSLMISLNCWKSSIWPVKRYVIVLLLNLLYLSAQIDWPQRNQALTHLFRTDTFNLYCCVCAYSLRRLILYNFCTSLCPFFGRVTRMSYGHGVKEPWAVRRKLILNWWIIATQAIWPLMWFRYYYWKYSQSNVLKISECVMF